MKLKNIIYILLLVGLVFTISLMFADNLINLLQNITGLNFVAQTPSDGFVTYFKVALIMSLILLSPLIFCLIVGFIKPALYDKEKLILNKIIKLTYLFIILFLLGMFFGAVMIFKVILPYLLEFNNQMGYQLLYGADSVIMFIIMSIIYTGLIFQIPIVNYYLFKFKVLKIKDLKVIRLITILGALFVGAIITPPDVLSMFIFSLPIWLLFEISTLIWRLQNVRNK